MLKSCGARGVGVASLAITVDEENVKWARSLWAGGLLAEGMPHGLCVEGKGIENPFV
jgi:hypothetical protein